MMAFPSVILFVAWLNLVALASTNKIIDLECAEMMRLSDEDRQAMLEEAGVRTAEDLAKHPRLKDCPDLYQCFGRCLFLGRSGMCRDSCLANEMAGNTCRSRNCRCCVPRTVDCSGPCSFGGISGWCRVDCFVSEVMLSQNSLGCKCCARNPCSGTCYSNGRTGMCKDKCSLGDIRLGTCGGGSCSCCQTKVIDLDCGGPCDGGYCARFCPAERRVKDRQGMIVPACRDGCTCCSDLSSVGIEGDAIP